MIDPASLDLDDNALKQLGPAMINALGGPEAFASILAGIIHRSESDQTKLKALNLVVQCVKNSAEADDDDPLGDMELEDIDEEIRKLTGMGSPKDGRDEPNEARP